MIRSPSERPRATLADFFARPEAERFHELIDREIVDQRVRAEPFEAIEFDVGVLFGDDDE